MLGVDGEHRFGYDGSVGHLREHVCGGVPRYTAVYKRSDHEAIPHANRCAPVPSTGADGVASPAGISVPPWNSRLGHGGCAPCVRTMTRR